MPTALLICLEDTFWYTGIQVSMEFHHTSNNFAEFFEESFTFYNESGMREKVEAEIDILTNEQGGSPATMDSDFVEKFYMTIIEKFLRKIYSSCFYFQSTHLITFFAEIQPARGTGLEINIWTRSCNEESLHEKLAAKIGTKNLNTVSCQNQLELNGGTWM